MLYIHVVRTGPASVLTAHVASEAEIEAHHKDPANKPLETRNDWKSFAAAEEVAAALGKDYIATDAGSHVSPRYDVIKLPKVGDKVSYAFNGDSYPCGVIVKVSKTKKAITTDGGKVFYRVRQSGSWRNDGTWSLTPGHVYKQNPEF